MYGPPGPAAMGMTVVPPRVAAAQEYLRFAEQLRNPSPMFEMHRVEPRDLTIAEQKVYNDALEVLRTYFNGECNYGDSSVMPTQPGDSDPKEKVPCPQ